MKDVIADELADLLAFRKVVPTDGALKLGLHLTGSDLDLGNLADVVRRHRRWSGTFHLVEQIRDDGIEPSSAPGVVTGVAVERQDGDESSDSALRSEVNTAEVAQKHLEKLVSHHDLRSGSSDAGNLTPGPSSASPA